MHKMTVKTSTIFIAKGDRTRVYRSVKEIPEGLRKELEQSTNGFNSATILITADCGARLPARSCALKGLLVGLGGRGLAPSLLLPERPPPPTPCSGSSAGRFPARQPAEKPIAGSVGAFRRVAELALAPRKEPSPRSGKMSVKTSRDIWQQGPAEASSWSEFSSRAPRSFASTEPASISPPTRRQARQSCACRLYCA